MPTGYTSSIKDGISFENFVLKCARNFGACIAWRKEHHVLFQEEYAEKLIEMVNNLNEENYKLWTKAIT